MQLVRQGVTGDLILDMSCPIRMSASLPGTGVTPGQGTKKPDLFNFRMFLCQVDDRLLQARSRLVQIQPEDVHRRRGYLLYG